MSRITQKTKLQNLTKTFSGISSGILQLILLTKSDGTVFVDSSGISAYTTGKTSKVIPIYFYLVDRSSNYILDRNNNKISTRVE
jgi:hypothetical protein